MKVTLKFNGKNRVYENCSAEIKDNEIIITREFKNGDIVINRREGRIAIFKKKDENEKLHDHAFLIIGRKLMIDDNAWNAYLEDWDFATEKEAQILLDALKKRGLQWNADKKCIEKLRWRAELGERYYFFDEFLEVQFTIEDENEDDDIYWGIGNYFKTREDAEAALLKVKNLLHNKS